MSENFRRLIAFFERFVEFVRTGIDEPPYTIRQMVYDMGDLIAVTMSLMKFLMITGIFMMLLDYYLEWRISHERTYACEVPAEYRKPFNPLNEIFHVHCADFKKLKAASPAIAPSSNPKAE